MHRGETGNRRFVIHGNVTGKLNVVRQDHAVAEVTVVCQMDV